MPFRSPGSSDKHPEAPRHRCSSGNQKWYWLPEGKLIVRSDAELISAIHGEEATGRIWGTLSCVLHECSCYGDRFVLPETRAGTQDAWNQGCLCLHEALCLDLQLWCFWGHTKGCFVSSIVLAEAEACGLMPWILGKVPTAEPGSLSPTRKDCELPANARRRWAGALTSERELQMHFLPRYRTSGEFSSISQPFCRHDRKETTLWSHFQIWR